MTLFDRRLAAEWQLLNQLSQRNPGRLTAMAMDGAVLTMKLHGPATVSVTPAGPGPVLSLHTLRFEFPVHFPAVPMELFLRTPIFHPNVHPETGFVCLWERHRVSDTVELALHKLVAMLAGELRNAQALHVMQPDALYSNAAAVPMPLLGVVHSDYAMRAPREDRPRRRRLHD